MAAANAKFVRRFQGVERVLVDQGKAVEDSTLGEMEAAWQEVKRIEQEG
jgi:ATP diphosphatase